ncbi:MAG: asparagine synthase (glutamine-hydrolyzing) [Pseudomonadota bacterium]
MCGIAGYDFTDTARTPSGLPQRLIDSLRPRGPDGSGIQQFARDGGDLAMVERDNAPLCMVHTRLAIIDLSDSGREPMPNEDTSVWLTFNGEIYNYPSLQRELQALGHVFRSSSDAEVIVHGYEAWGDSVVTRLRGMFAFALLDLHRDRWLCARDPFGVKPLVYAHRPGLFAFASDLNALRLVPGIDLGVDGNALAQYLALGYVPAPHTICRGARKLPRGHTLVVQDGAMQVHAYAHSAPVRPITRLSEAVEEIRDALEESVQAHLIADVPVGCFLSGGVDSALVASLAAQSGATPSCFTMGFAEQAYDERPAARSIAGQLGLPWQERELRPETLRDALQDLARIFDEPFADPSAAPTSLIARFARRQVKCVLSGDGGDELFLGYTRYRLFALAERVRQVPRPARAAIARAAARIPARTIDRMYGRLRALGQLPRLTHPARKLQAVAASLASDDRLRLYADTLRIASPDVLERVAPTFETLALEALERAAPPGLDVPSALYASRVDEQTFLPEDILTKVDRASMAVGLEVRVPFLDSRVAAVARAVGPELHVRDGGKAVLRGVLRGVLDPAPVHRPKQGFTIPLAEWLRGPLREEMDATCHDSVLGDLGLSIPGVTRLADEHLRRERDHAPLIWALVCLRRHLQLHDAVT